MDNSNRALAKRIEDLRSEFHKLRDTPWKQDQTGTGPQHTANKEREHAPGEVQFAASPQAPPSPANQEKSNKPWYKTAYGWQSKLALPKLILEIVGILFAVGYAVVTYCQWRDLRDNFKLDQRAWLGVRVIELKEPIKAGEKVGFSVRFFNSGKTPALRIHITEMEGGFSERSFIPSPYKMPTISSVTPPQGDTTYFFYTEPIDQIAADSIAKGAMRIYIRGAIEYRDIFGDVHHTKYCASYPGSAGPVLTDCDSGNSLD